MNCAKPKNPIQVRIKIKWYLEIQIDFVKETLLTQYRLGPIT